MRNKADFTTFYCACCTGSHYKKLHSDLGAFNSDVILFPCYLFEDLFLKEKNYSFFFHQDAQDIS